MHQNFATVSQGVTRFSQNVQKLINNPKIGQFDYSIKYRCLAAGK